MYKCQFPNCSYECNERSYIHNHHIVPKELGGSDKSGNRIYLCPNCHCRVYIPESSSGIHSIKSNNSIIIIGWLMSTAGKVLEYINSNEELTYNFYDEGINGLFI